MGAELFMGLVALFLAGFVCGAVLATLDSGKNIDTGRLDWLLKNDRTRIVRSDGEICLKTPKSTLYKLCRKGTISGRKLGKRLLFDREEVDRQIKLRSKKGPRQEVAHGVQRKQAS